MLWQDTFAVWPISSRGFPDLPSESLVATEVGRCAVGKDLN